VISDDASTDATIAVAEEFAARASFPVRIHRNEKPVGAAENFMRAAERCAGPLVAFSDQDDAWDPAKLSRCTMRFDDREVQLVVHGWTVVDDELRELERDVPTADVVERYRAPKWGQAPGMAMVFRRALLDMLEWGDRPPPHEPGRVLLHDEWVYGLARVAGKIVFLDESLCLYRQHARNVEGAPDRGLTRQAELALSLGGDYYLRRAEQGEAWAALLRGLAPGEAASYQRLARNLRARASVYSDRRRLRALVRAARAGAYRGRDREGFGLRGLTRDAVLIALGRR
jgi:glycosyltransferase involved in cell wall biosynthesis